MSPSCTCRRLPNGVLLRGGLLPAIALACLLDPPPAAGQVIVRPPRPVRIVPLPPIPEGDMLGTRYDSQLWVQRLLTQATPGIVTVFCRRTDGAVGSATGVVATAEGLVVTSRRAVAYKDTAAVLIQPVGGQPVEAGVVALDDQTDLAVLWPAKGLTGCQPLRGRPLGDVQKGHAVLSIGYPAAPWVGLYRGKLSETYSCDALQKAMPGRFEAKHGYSYLETDVPMTPLCAGAPLLDEEGAVVGICAWKAPTAKMGFAIEWRAAEEMATKAVGAAPMPLDKVRAFAPAAGTAQPFGQPTTAHHIRTAVTKHRYSMYCRACNGVGQVTETRKRTTLESRPYTAVIDKRYVTRYRTVEVVKEYKVQVGCNQCGRQKVTPKPEDAHAGLCELLAPMAALDPSSWQAAVAWQEASDVLEQACIDSPAYSAALTTASGIPLATPAECIGRPVVFTGRVASAMTLGDLVLYTVAFGPRGDVATVVFRGRRGLLLGQPCQVSGTICGYDGAVPFILAAGIFPPHEPDPAYRPSRLASPAGGSPTPAVAPASRPAGSTNVPAHRLKTARMFIGNKLNDKAAEILQEILSDHPDSPEAKEAAELLPKLKPKE